MNKSKILEILRISMSLLEDKQGTTNKYVFNTLKCVFEYIKSEKKEGGEAFNRAKYLHRGVECIEEMIDKFGLESTYIYCVMQVFKHMYLHDNDSNEETEYSIAEFYKFVANDIEKRI